MRQLLVGDTAPGQTQHRQHCMLLEQGYCMHCEPKVYRQHPPPRTTVSGMGLLSCLAAVAEPPVLCAPRQRRGRCDGGLARCEGANGLAALKVRALGRQSMPGGTGTIALDYTRRAALWPSV